MLKKILFFFLIIHYINCKEEPVIPNDFDYGSIDGDVYVNDYFKFCLPFNDSWHLKSQQKMQEIAKAGKELILNDSYKKLIEDSAINNTYLFNLNQFGPDEFVAYNPSLSIVAEKTTMFPNIKRGSHYLKEVQKILNKTAVNCAFNMIDKEFIIGKQHFDVMDISMDYLGLVITQRYYTTVKKGFSLSIIMSYTTEEQKVKLQRMIDSIVFYKSISKNRTE